MNILITGGTGLIGRHFIHQFESTYRFTVLTRDQSKASQLLPQGCEYISSLDPFRNLDQFDAIINLAGEPIVDKRWSPQQKDIITDSRLSITQQLADLCNQSRFPPEVFISGSAIGFYGRQGSEKISETFNRPFDEFSHQLCKQWEAIALQASSAKTRVCILRTGIVLADDGGALAKMLLPFKCGLGGPIASGNQYMSWIHIRDMVNGIHHLVKRPSSKGIYNLTAPEPETNKAFAKKLCNALHRPCLLPMPEFALRLLMGEAADLLVYGQNVVPDALINEGFHFLFPQLEDAFTDLTL
ncbi:TIGR01777 family oxidoreductase [Alteromonas facilis]|uniref:TIGR01777 family oxidoreductase n=1 Tax=Alteromonas facilis TaxID=2048004 RepID=UPI000C286B02|nr:TIGR01777 family oxidoreductase [Alteromonas facilis]